MMRTRPVVAIDVGSTKVACVVGQPRAQDARLDVLGVGLASHPTLMAAWPCDPAVLARTIEQALEATGVTQSLERASVVLSHPGLSHTRPTAQIELADEPVLIRRRDLARLKDHALSQAVSLDHAPLYVACLGYAGNGFERVRDPVGLAATRLSGAFQVVSIPLAVRQAVMRAVEAVGLEVEQLVYSLEAIAVSCLDAPWRQARCLVIDLGGCSTQVGIVAQGVFERTRSIPWGGMTLVETLAKACQLTMDQALTASLEGLSSSKPMVRKLTQQQLPILQRGVHQLLKGDALPEVAVVTGRGALIDGMVEWVEEMTEINTILGRSPHAKHLGDLARQVAFSPALGVLELTCRTSTPTTPKPSRLIERLLERTKTILIEYF